VHDPRCRPRSSPPHRVGKYQVARKLSTGRPPRIPETVIRCAATVPALRVPAAIWTGRRTGPGDDGYLALDAPTTLAHRSPEIDPPTSRRITEHKGSCK
jgi:hypothetical protein